LALVVVLKKKSLPPLGSVRASAQYFSPRRVGTMYLCFCSSVPKASTASVTMETTVATQAGTMPSLEISLRTKSSSTHFSPLPPYLGEHLRPSSLLLPISCRSSFGNLILSASMSRRYCLGTLLTKSLASSRSFFCSSVRKTSSIPR
jgi:hypothetical protein